MPRPSPAHTSSPLFHSSTSLSAPQPCKTTCHAVFCPLTYSLYRRLLPLLYLL